MPPIVTDLVARGILQSIAIGAADVIGTVGIGTAIFQFCRMFALGGLAALLKRDAAGTTDLGLVIRFNQTSTFFNETASQTQVRVEDFDQENGTATICFGASPGLCGHMDGLRLTCSQSVEANGTATPYIPSGTITMRTPNSSEPVVGTWKMSLAGICTQWDREWVWLQPDTKSIETKHQRRDTTELAQALQGIVDRPYNATELDQSCERAAESIRHLLHTGDASGTKNTISVVVGLVLDAHQGHSGNWWKKQVLKQKTAPPRVVIDKIIGAILERLSPEEREAFRVFAQSAIMEQVAYRFQHERGHNLDGQMLEYAWRGSMPGDPLHKTQ